MLSAGNFFRSGPTRTKRIDACYEELYRRAAELLQPKRHLILDATFVKEAHRERARSIAEEAGVEWKMVEVVSTDRTVKQRMGRRSNDASEATYIIYERYKKAFEPVGGEHIVINNSGSLKNTERQVVHHFP